MARTSITAAFRDPARRPRMIVWTGVIVMVFIAVAIVGIWGSSTYWFCANVCHKVQDDTISAYNASAHDKISCLACHMPVDADPVTFLLHKVEAGVDGGIKVVTNTYELPINPESELSQNAEVMPERQCTQCHSANRILTPSEGVLIDHEVHSKEGVTCAMCHNRAAHNDEAITLTLEGNRKHEDFMKMEGCFRCHVLEGNPEPEGEWKASGACALCHPAGFELKPAGHNAPGFYTQYGNSKKHAQAAKADAAKVKAGGTSYCDMCHVSEQFCEGCHGVPMPHPEGFEEGHGDLGKESPETCANCHAQSGAASATGTQFCDSCHHKGSDPTKPWIDQHYVHVAESGPSECFECHNPAFCSHCHVTAIKQ